MSASVVSPCMFRSYTWPSSGDVPCTVLLSALLLRHHFTWVCGRIFYLCCCHVHEVYLGMWPYLLSVLLSCIWGILGYVAVSSVCVVVMYMRYTWVCGRIFYLCCCHVYEVYMATTQIEDTATYPSKIVTKQQGGKQHCTRNVPWRWSSVWPKHVGWHNRCRHSDVLKSDCVLVCILKYSAWVGFLNNVR